MKKQKAPAGGVKGVIEMFQHLDPTTRNRILAELVERDPKLAAQIQAKLITFEDVSRVNVRVLQKLLAKIPDQKLALALRGASDLARQTVFLNLATRRSQEVQAEMKNLGPQRAENVEKAQQEIAEELRALLDPR